MPLGQVIILAIVQGITEFLPISSTAHLYLTSWLLGWKPEELTFDIALHIGTLLAVLVYFFKDWVQIIGQAFGFQWGDNPDLRRNRGLLWLMALGTIPVGVAGLLFSKQAETVWRNATLMGGMLVGVGLLIALADRFSRRTRGIAGLNLADAVIVGVAQALAIVPGTSRSGITITAALFRDLDRHAAARFSFLLSTPAIGAAAAKAVYDLMKHGGIAPGMETAFVAGVAVSAVTGFIVIAWFLRFLQKRSLMFFVYYRIVFGIIVLALAFFRNAG
ncbi:MAG: undecaprenyl-diphosphatase UppP [Bryobacterales bacterium]|nr:undecaprenyl-diphosphatase UppP [Bryobacterales bacterium]